LEGLAADTHAPPGEASLPAVEPAAEQAAEPAAEPADEPAADCAEDVPAGAAAGAEDAGSLAVVAEAKVVPLEARDPAAGELVPERADERALTAGVAPRPAAEVLGGLLAAWIQGMLRPALWITTTSRSPRESCAARPTDKARHAAATT